MSFLLLCLLFLTLGFISGQKLKMAKKLTRRISESILFFILISLGYKVGSNREILNSLNSLGLQALVICLAGVLGSIFAVWLYLSRRKSSDH